MSLHVCLNALQNLSKAVPGVSVIVSGDPSQARPGGSCSAQLLLPWCGRKLIWNVLLQVLPPYPAPDFVFDDDTFCPLNGSLRPDQAQHLAHLLASWAPACASQGPQAVTSLLTQMVQLLLVGFREHQLARMAAVRNDRLQFELSTLPSLLPPPPTSTSPPQEAPPLMDLGGGSGGGGVSGGGGGVGGVISQEVVLPAYMLEALLVEQRGSEPALACLGIPLSGLDTSRAARVVSGFDARPQGPGSPSSSLSSSATSQTGMDPLKLAAACKLQVAFPVTGARTVPNLSLQVPSQLQGPGGLVSPQLPAWDPHSCLMEVLPQVVQRLQGAMDAWAAVATLRQQLLESISATLGAGPPLELNLREGAGLWAVAWEGVPLLVSIQCCPPPGGAAQGAGSVGGGGGAGTSPGAGGAGGGGAGGAFPEEKPLLTVSNVRHLGAQAGTRSWRDYPWSPRWPPAEMAARITLFLRGEIPAFLGIKNGAAPAAEAPIS